MKLPNQKYTILENVIKPTLNRTTNELQWDGEMNIKKKKNDRMFYDSIKLNIK